MCNISNIPATSVEFESDQDLDMNGVLYKAIKLDCQTCGSPKSVETYVNDISGDIDVISCDTCSNEKNLKTFSI